MRDKIRVPNLIRMHERCEKIVALTAYDYPLARLLDNSGVHLILVGDSLGTVVQGHATTLGVTLEQMVYHTSMVSRGSKNALVIADMPFMSYQASTTDAVRNAGLLVKQGGAEGVKLEGAGESLKAIERIVSAGIPVMGHVGLLPQAVHAMGGYRVQGRATLEAQRIIDDARSIEEAGAFSIVLECIPEAVAAQITNSLSIPTIGIGAGRHCSGQILVLNDLLGFVVEEDSKPPSFVKQYADLDTIVSQAVRSYAQEVTEGAFPTEKQAYSANVLGESAKSKRKVGGV